jgi:HD-GYP domain-containing protein (c-di-GMP phosphodiesterase class II)
VLAGFRQRQRLESGAELEIANLPFEALARAARAVGSVVLPVDPDGVVRRAPEISEIAGIAHTSLAGGALAVALREPVATASNRAPRPIDYRRAAPPIATLSIIDVLEDRFDPRDVAGRAVFVGATAAEFQDLWATPLGPARPGVWIQAMLYRTLAAERAVEPVLARPSALASLGVLWLLSFAAATSNLAAGSHHRRVARLVGIGGTVVACSLAALVQLGWLWVPVLPLGVVASHYALGVEGVRRRIARHLAANEQSLVALERVGEVTARPGDGHSHHPAEATDSSDPLDVALALLGDVVDARGVALLRAAPDGGLDGRRLEWQRSRGGVAGDAATAQRVLEQGTAEVFEGNAPGSDAPSVAVYTPLFAAQTPVGVLVVERDGADALAPTQRRTISTVGAQLALSVHNLHLVDQLRSTFDSAIEALASAVEARDGYTESHCRRLAIFSTTMADRLGLPDEEIEAIRLGALLHDVGKIGIRDEILLKPGRFVADELAQMQQHTAIGHGIVGTICGLGPTTLCCVRNHHERWDGTGYPDRLGGEAIPLGARIVSVVDVWDALSTARPYKAAYEQSRVRSILRKSRGTHFEPRLVDLFLDILDEEGDEMLALIEAPRASAAVVAGRDLRSR